MKEATIKVFQHWRMPFYEIECSALKINGPTIKMNGLPPTLVKRGIQVTFHGSSKLLVDQMNIQVRIKDTYYYCQFIFDANRIFMYPYRMIDNMLLRWHTLFQLIAKRNQFDASSAVVRSVDEFVPQN